MKKDSRRKEVVLYQGHGATAHEQAQRCDGEVQK